MTIKTRNRLNISLFFISITFLVFYLVILGYLLITDSLDLSVFSLTSQKNFILFRNSPVNVLISIFIEVLYVSVTSLFLFRAFEKTQANDIVYFALFLFSCLADSLRILIPFFKISQTYTKLLVFCGNATLFGKFLLPLSLLCTVIMNEIEQRQDLERNMFIIILVAAVFAYIIPINTATIRYNFEVDFSFHRTILIAISTILVVTIGALFIYNIQRGYNQITTIGIALISMGISLLFAGTNLLRIIIAVLALSFGTTFFLKTRHRQYLWED